MAKKIPVKPIRSSIKIKVIKKIHPSELYGNEPPIDGTITDVCPRLEVGQEFLVGEDGNMPEGFCTWAWNDIYGALTHLMFGGDFPWVQEKGKLIACCTDGMRPVFFKLERI